MLKKMLSYILSFRRDVESIASMKVRLAELHKMNSDDTLEIAYLSCRLAIESQSEEVKTLARIKTKVTARAENIGMLIAVMQRVHNAMLAENTNGKYISVPDWLSFSQKTVSVDDYFANDQRRLGVVYSLTEVCRMLKEMREEIKKPKNEKFMDYYQDKPKKIYAEVASIASTFII